MNKELQVYRGDEFALQNAALSAGVRDAGADRLDVHSLLGTLRRRMLLFAAVFLAIVALGLVLTLRQTPMYTATATVVIETARERLTPGNDQILQESGSGSAVIDTEVQVIQSNELANQVAAALNLDQALRFDPTQAPPGRRARIMAWIRGNDGDAPVPQRAIDPQAQREYVINILKAGLEVTRSGLTYALTVSFTANDPRFAALIANEYSKQYSQQALLRKQRANANAVKILTERVAELRAEAQKDTQAVQLYRIRNNLLSSNASQLTEQEVSTYNQSLANARASAAEERARLATARQQLRGGSNGEDVGAALESGVISGLKSQRATLTGQLAELTTRYGPEHPDVLKAKNQLADVNQSIRNETTNVVSNLSAKQAIANQRLGSVSGSLGQARGTLAASNQALVGFDDLTRKAQASQGLYEAYLDRLKQASAQEGTEQPEARTITWAQTPERPSSPNVPLNLFLSVMLGLGAGLAAAFITELAFRGLTTGDDIETRLGIRYLGSVPLAKSVFKSKLQPLDALLDRPQSAFAESYRSLLASLNQSVDPVVQVVTITSALPQEGKSTVAGGMARIAALDGEKVVLLDCDQRRRSVNKLVPNPREVGLFEVLRGEASIDDALVLDEPSGAWLLPLNSKRIAPGEHFTGEPMRRLLDDLRERFTLIIIDSAPVLPIADTRLIATMADAVIMVARWRKTPDHAVRSALKLLPPGRINLAGAVLTQVDIRRQAKFGYGDPTYYYNQYKEYYG